MKDFLGKELNIGDEVVYLNHSRTSSTLRRGIVMRFTPMKIEIESYSEDGRHLWNDTKYPRHVVKVSWEND